MFGNTPTSINDMLSQFDGMKPEYSSDEPPNPITEDDITSKNWKLIKQKLKLSIDYNSIIKDINTTEALEIARKVSTNLIPLKDNQIDALVKHASVLTEIQVKLYCVSLFK